MSPVFLYLSAPALSAISLGGATFGREIDECAAFALMDHARLRGVTLFDTAASYSAGASERIIGAWLASRRPEPGTLSVATKIYPPFTSDTIDEAVTASTSRLHVETIDILYLHKWESAAATPTVLRALDLLVRNGRVRALGASNFNADQLRVALALQSRLGLVPFRVLQNNNNLAVQGVDGLLGKLCEAHGLAIITYSPLGAGFLTGKHRNGVQPGSRFAVSPSHEDIYFNPTAERRLMRLAEVSARTGYAMPHLALAWALHRPGVASVLIGGRRPAHLDQAFDALVLEDSALFAELESTGKTPSL